MKRASTNPIFCQAIFFCSSGNTSSFFILMVCVFLCMVLLRWCKVCILVCASIIMVSCCCCWCCATLSLKSNSRVEQETSLESCEHLEKLLVDDVVVVVVVIIIINTISQFSRTKRYSSNDRQEQNHHHQFFLLLLFFLQEMWTVVIISHANTHINWYESTSMCYIVNRSLKSNVVHLAFMVCSNASTFNVVPWLNGQFIGWFELMSRVKFNELADATPRDAKRVWVWRLRWKLRKYFEALRKFVDNIVWKYLRTLGFMYVVQHSSTQQFIVS